MNADNTQNSIPVPGRIACLRHDEQMTPIPYFVAWQKEGKPAKAGEKGAVPLLHVVDTGKRDDCIQRRLCWICGVPLGRLFAFVGGPQIGINQISLHGAMHTDCARYIATAHASLLAGETNSKSRSGEKMLQVSTDVLLLWQCRGFSILEAGQTRRLFHLTPAYLVDWFCKGRSATRAEVERAIRLIVPGLEEIATRVNRLDQMRTALDVFLKTYLPEN